MTLPSIDFEKALTWVQQKTSVALAARPTERHPDRPHVEDCGDYRRPRVGKTTIVNSIVKILRAKNGKVLLAAPTGRAANE